MERTQLKSGQGSPPRSIQASKPFPGAAAEGVPTSGWRSPSPHPRLRHFGSLRPLPWQSRLVEQEGPGEISMDKLPAGSKGQQRDS